jgi:ubiquinone/menaquinone biosynthesis C-methylase UbiE
MTQNGADRDRIWNFQRRDYWNDRYIQRLRDQAEVFNEAKFDWLCTYHSIRRHVDPYLADAAFALDIGCGNSDFAAAVCAAHPLLHVIGIDYSSSLFELCGSSLGPSSSTDWLVMDACALAVRENTFDVVFDKGCLDALCAGCDQIALLRSWGRDVTSKEVELSRAATASVMQLLRQVERCLVPGGRWVHWAEEPSIG